MSRRSSIVRVIKCFHGCIIIEKDARRCPGFERHDCKCYVSYDCWKLNHRCGVNECQCMCSKCKTLNPVPSNSSTCFTENELPISSEGYKIVKFTDYTSQKILSDDESQSQSESESESESESSIKNEEDVFNSNNDDDIDYFSTESNTDFLSTDRSNEIEVVQKHNEPLEHSDEKNVDSFFLPIEDCLVEDDIIKKADALASGEFIFSSVVRGVDPTRRLDEMYLKTHTIEHLGRCYTSNVDEDLQSLSVLIIWKLTNNMGIDEKYCEIMTMNDLSNLRHHGYMEANASIKTIETTVVSEEVLSSDKRAEITDMSQDTSLSNEEIFFSNRDETNVDKSSDKQNIVEDLDNENTNAILSSDDQDNTFDESNLSNTIADEEEINKGEADIHKEINVDENQGDSDFDSLADATRNRWKEWPSCDIPIHIIEKEAEQITNLKELYRNGSSREYLEVGIGGHAVKLFPFHYPPQNNVAEVKTERSMYCSYISEENIRLFRWDLKGAITTKMMYDKKKYSKRVYYSMCQLDSWPSKLVKSKQYILLMIMTTLCKDFRNDFVVYDTITKRVGIWEDYDIIKRFWCLPDYPVDLAELKQERRTCITRHRWEYDPLRGQPRDCKNPETDVAGSASKTLIAEVEAKWKMTRGRAPDMSAQRLSRTMKEKDSSPGLNVIMLESNKRPKSTDNRQNIRLKNSLPGQKKINKKGEEVNCYKDQRKNSSTINNPKNMKHSQKAQEVIEVNDRNKTRNSNINTRYTKNSRGSQEFSSIINHNNYMDIEDIDDYNGHFNSYSNNYDTQPEIIALNKNKKYESTKKTVIEKNSEHEHQLKIIVAQKEKAEKEVEAAVEARKLKEAEAALIQQAKEAELEKVRLRKEELELMRLQNEITNQQMEASHQMKLKQDKELYEQAVELEKIKYARLAQAEKEKESRRREENKTIIDEEKQVITKFFDEKYARAKRKMEHKHELAEFKEKRQREKMKRAQDDEQVLLRIDRENKYLSAFYSRDIKDLGKETNEAHSLVLHQHITDQEDRLQNKREKFLK